MYSFCVVYLYSICCFKITAFWDVTLWFCEHVHHHLKMEAGGFLQNVGTGTPTPNYAVHIPDYDNLNICFYGNRSFQYLI
jgi:hypothetical protein